jgi:hypothetical protein
MSDALPDGAAEEPFDDVEPPEWAGPVELGIYSVDELAALAPGRVDLLDGDVPDPAAGARALLAGGRVQLAAGDDSELAGVPTEAAAVVARFLTQPERTVVVRVDDLFGTDQYALHGRDVDGTQCYVLEGGTAGVRRLLFLLAADAPSLVAELTGLDDLGEAANRDEPQREVDIDAEPPESPLGAALVHPTRSVTLSAGSTGGEPVDISFVHHDDAAWVLEWTGETTARVSPLDSAAVSEALANVLG